jgi:hypothetical protein
MILPVDLCGCETWSLAPREDGRMRVFEIKELRGIFEPKRVGQHGNTETYMMCSFMISTVINKNII